jgi:hypothetical protein
MVRYDNAMKTPEMLEGPAAFERFQSAVRAVLTVPKSAVPSPFSKPKPKAKKPTTKVG